MKKRFIRWKGILGIGLSLVILTGCGSAKSEATAAYETTSFDNSAAEYETNDIYSEDYDGEYVLEDAVEDVAEETAESVEEAAVQDSDRKLIRNVNLEVETESFDELLDTVSTKTKALGGYIEESYTYNGSNYYGRTNRNANLTIRIPAEKLDDFLSAVSDESNVISRDESVTDVTLQYVDMESHKNVLQSEQERLIALMEQAETIEDMIALENRLSQVRYQIESMESQLRTYDNQVNYSTVYLYVNEVTQLTPVKEQSLGEKIATGFMNSLYSVGHGLLNFVVGLIIRLPYLVVGGIMIIGVIWIIKAIRKSRRKRKQKKEMKMAETVQAAVEVNLEQDNGSRE